MTADQNASDELPPRRRRRKRRRQRLEPTTRERFDSAGRERAVFILDFPADPELESLIAAFEEGDYARVRREAPALAARTDNPAVRNAALELRRRIDPDPLVKYLLGVSIALLVFLVLWVYETHGQP
jgi:hypothetical protein